jgi:rubrerythrin
MTVRSWPLERVLREVAAMNDRPGTNDANRRIDELIQRLIEADQQAAGIEPMKVAHELGEIKLALARRKTILPRPGGEGHWRCEACGTISHASAKPDRCPACGAKQLWPADLAQPNVESGAG